MQAILRLLHLINGLLTETTTAFREIFSSLKNGELLMLPVPADADEFVNNNCNIISAGVAGASSTPKPIVMTKRLLFFGTFLSVLFLTLAFSTKSFGQATLTTDQPDYTAGMTVILTGTGFEPGESVTVQVIDWSEPGDNETNPLHQPWTVIANENGGFTTTWYVDEFEYGLTLKATADGQSSGLHAETLFTDANAANGDGTMTVSPVSVCTGTTANTFIFTFSSPNGKDFNSGSQLQLTIPTGWTAPQNTNSANPGFISLTAGTGVTGLSISSIIGNVILVNMTCPGGRSFTLTYGGGTSATKVTAPSVSTNTNYPFNTKTKQSGGTLTDIGTHPQITVNATPTTANAGPNQTLCAGSTVQLAANNATIGTGVWSIVSVPAGGSTSTGQFNNTSNFNATFTQTNPTSGVTGTYVLRWTISNGACTASSSDVQVTFAAKPTGAIRANQDQDVCEGATTANILIDVTGTGPWSGTLSDGTAFSGASSPLTATVSPSVTTTYTIATLQDANCLATSKTGSAKVTIKATPTGTIQITGATTVCNGGTSSIKFSGPKDGVIKYTVNGSDASIDLGGGGNVTISPTFTTTTTYTLVSASYKNAPSCETSVSGTVTVTVVAQPVAPVIAKDPDVATVCAGQTLTISITTAGTGGTGTSQDEYRYNNGSGFTAWTTTIPSFAAVAGTNTIESRRTSTGTGCNTSSSNSVSWTVVAQPVGPVIAKDPDVAAVCAGQILTISVTTGGTGGTGTSQDEYRYNDGSGFTSWSTTTPSFAAVVGTNTIESRRTSTGTGCTTAAGNTVSWTVVAQPVAPVIAKDPNVATVCAGQTLTISITTAGTGGAGTSQDEYRYNDGSGLTPWSTTVPSFAAVVGTNTIESRRTSTGTGCNNATGNTVSWTVVAAPVGPVIAKDPDVAAVCAGQILTISVTTGGTGGTGTSQDEYRYNDGSGFTSWSTTTPSFAAVVGTNTIESRRTSTGTGCTTAAGNTVSWTVVAQPVAPVIAKDPNVATVCAGQTLTISITTAGTGGAGTSQDEYRYNDGSGLTPWSTTVPSFTAVVGTNTIESRRTSTGTGCNNATGNTVSWTVVAQPSSGSLTKYPNVATVCEGTNVKATAGAGSGGVSGTTTDIVEYRYDADDDSDPWTAYTSGSNLSTTGHTKVEIRTYRTSTGTGCNASTPNVVSWNVNAQPVFTAPTGAGTTLANVQYSDPIASTTITASDDGGGSGISISSQWRLQSSATWTSGLPSSLSLSAQSTSGNTKSWTLSGNVYLAPGIYEIKFTAADASSCGANTLTLQFTVTQEDARTFYTGGLCVATSTATATTATVTLSATIKDISAMLASEPGYDSYKGNISRAKVMFINRAGNVPISGWLNVGLVNPSDSSTGTVVFNWPNVPMNQQFTVGIVVGGIGYYTRNSCTEDVVVNVYQPNGDFITGGGYLILTNSSGQKAGDVNTKNNFGFNVKYNKAGTNLQGTMNIIFRRKESDYLVHTYQIKGTAMSNLSVKPVTTPNSSTPSTATFNSKAAIQDITNPLAPINCDGGTLQVTLSDAGEPGKYDKIGIVLYNKNGGVWFSSNWDGTKTVNQQLEGGNLVVRGGAVGACCTTSSPSTLDESTRIDIVTPGTFKVRAFPNPTTHQFTIDVQSASNEPIEVKVFDMMGHMVYYRNGLLKQEHHRFGQMLTDGMYMLHVRQGDKQQTITVIKK